MYTRGESRSALSGTAPALHVLYRLHLLYMSSDEASGHSLSEYPGLRRAWFEVKVLF